MNLPKKIQKEYIDMRGEVCPYCGNGNLRKTVFLEVEYPVRFVQCLGCLRLWKEIHERFGEPLHSVGYRMKSLAPIGQFSEDILKNQTDLTKENLIEKYRDAVKRYKEWSDKKKEEYGSEDVVGSWGDSDFRKVLDWNNKLQYMAEMIGLTDDEVEAIDLECGIPVEYEEEVKNEKV